MSITPNISARRWIRWIPDLGLSEPTDTIVLTSAASSFIDIRTLLGFDVVAAASNNPSNPNSTSLTDLSPAAGPKPADQLHAHAALGRDELAVTMDRLDWAFAGRSERGPPTKQGGGGDQGGKKATAHGIYHHTIDSRHVDPTGVRDEGHFYDYEEDAGGAQVLELEKGEMENSATGTVQRYEELWADVPVNILPADEGRRVCVVLQTADGKGMVIRVGQFCQGILRNGQDIVVERWRWDMGGKGGKGDAMWKRLVRMGQGQVPCNATFETSEVAKGRVFELGGNKWTVEEVVRW